MSASAKRLRCGLITSRRRRTRIVLAALLTAGVTLSATTLAGAAPAARAPGWKVIPGVRAIVGYQTRLGWASNRVWVAFDLVHGSRMSVTSAAIAGRSLGGFKTDRVSVDGYVRLIVASELVYSAPPDASSLVARQLLPSGGLGPPSAVPLDTKRIAANQRISPQAALRVGGRTVWALPGATRGSNPRGVFWVCCAVDGSARDLTRFIDRALSPTLVRWGLDGRGRLWLAWNDRGRIKVVELDPSSLLPRTSRPTVAPVRVVERFELACAAACRLVIEGGGTGIHSWAPGDRSPTRIATIVKRGGYNARLLAAAYRSGKLAVAYIPVDAPFGVRVVRGDARGARSRRIGRLRSSTEGIATYAAFGPAGLVAVTPVTEGYLSAVRIGLIRLPR